MRERLHGRALARDDGVWRKTVAGSQELLHWRKVSEIESTRLVGTGSFLSSTLSHGKEGGASNREPEHQWSSKLEAWKKVVRGENMSFFFVG